MFYINYVVCKFSSFSNANTPFTSFILTMWYVNNFYELKNTKCKSSFILTMWYVNVGTLKYLLNTSNSFILTMWYVNAS